MNVTRHEGTVLAELLREGSRGQEVLRLQRNLNAAIGRRYGQLVADGIFGPKTKAATQQYQRDFKLQPDGTVGEQTRKALATRVFVLKGVMSRSDVPQQVTTSYKLSSAVTAPTPTGPSQPSPWLVQLQPAVGITPRPFFAPSPIHKPTLFANQLALGLVYRTASEGPHWEFGVAGQPSYNSRTSMTDPRYTLQLQGSASYADPWSAGRFHSALFGQVILLQNLAPASTVVAAQLGAQVSVDIIADRWNLFAQGALVGQWTLYDSGGPAGALSFGSAFTLGTTIQWGTLNFVNCRSRSVFQRRGVACLKSSRQFSSRRR